MLEDGQVLPSHTSIAVLVGRGCGRRWAHGGREGRSASRQQLSGVMKKVCLSTQSLPTASPPPLIHSGVPLRRSAWPSSKQISSWLTSSSICSTPQHSQSDTPPPVSMKLKHYIMKHDSANYLYVTSLQNQGLVLALLLRAQVCLYGFCDQAQHLHGIVRVNYGTYTDAVRDPRVRHLQRG